MKIDLKLGDCLEVLKTIPDNSVDSVVTDPPYGLSFMNKKWDYDVPSVDIWKECLRVLKPGGHLLSFSGSRTYHRMAVRIEDAGFEIRDQIMWIYGSGFPKSHNIGKAVDKLLGNEREVVGVKENYVDFTDEQFVRQGSMMMSEDAKRKDLPITKGQSEWEGWGTALKPAHEPIVVARKPLSEKTVSENVLKWGTGGINIDDCRIGTESWIPNNEGRWPANIILDEEAGHILDEQSGISGTGKKKVGKERNGFLNSNNTFELHNNKTTKRIEDYGDKGGASRFFYCPKASKKDRDEGLDNFEEYTSGKNGRGLDRMCSECGTKMVNQKDCVCENPNWIDIPKKNYHPTVKPTNLMLYLIKLVTPKGGTTLDLFMGSGSTGKAAVRGGFNFIGIEKEQEYMKISEARINNENKPQTVEEFHAQEMNKWGGGINITING